MTSAEGRPMRARAIQYYLRNLGIGPCITILNYERETHNQMLENSNWTHKKKKEKYIN